MQETQQNKNEVLPNFYEVKHGILSWLFTMDHKRLGLNYMVSLMIFFSVAVILGLLMKIELIAPGKTIMDADTYNMLFTLHGVIMIFMFVIPGVPAVFGNFFLPIMIGAPDVSFPRVNLLSWWLLIIGGSCALLSLLTPEGFADTGWTFYAPYSTEYSTHNVILATSAAFLLGFSSILTGINFLTTIHRLRAPGMTWFRMPLFVWGLYATGWIQIIATPVIGITLLLVILERVFGAGIFDPSKGGDPILFQHLFWIYSHPAVYVMIVPAMGIISEVIPVFARRTIFGYKAIAISSLAIAFLGSLVWAHHMFTSGMSDLARWVFSLLTFLVAIPSAVKVFNWVATLYKGSIDIKPPLLYALTFIFLFSIGGLTGMVNGALSTDIHIHDTYFVVAHFHYVMFGGTAFAIFAGLHYWFPKMFGKMYNLKLATIAWAVIFIGFNLLYFPMIILGLEGMPRRYFDYLPEFTGLNVFSSVGAIILVLGMAGMAINLIYAFFKGKKETGNPWYGVTLEWKTQTPPPLYNFATPPVITEDPYKFNPDMYKTEK